MLESHKSLFIENQPLLVSFHNINDSNSHIKKNGNTKPNNKDEGVNMDKGKSKYQLCLKVTYLYPKSSNSTTFFRNIQSKTIQGTEIVENSSTSFFLHSL